MKGWGCWEERTLSRWGPAGRVDVSGRAGNPSLLAPSLLASRLPTPSLPGPGLLSSGLLSPGRLARRRRATRRAPPALASPHFPRATADARTNWTRRRAAGHHGQPKGAPMCGMCGSTNGHRLNNGNWVCHDCGGVTAG